MIANQQKGVIAMKKSAFTNNMCRFANCGNSCCASENIDILVLMACAVSTFILLGLVVSVAAVSVIICAVIILAVIVGTRIFTEHRHYAKA